LSQCDFEDRLDAFAIGSLDEDERLEILAHMRSCRNCATTAGDYLEGLSVLALGVGEREPPRSLRQVIMAEATRSVDPRPASTASTRWSQWMMAAAAGIAAVSLAWSIKLNNDLETQRTTLTGLSRRYDTIVGVLAANRVTIQNMSASESAPGSMGRVFLDQETGSGMIMHKLPPLGEGQCYQLWFVGHGERVDGGVLRTNPDGSGYTIIQAPGPVSSFETIGVTREPAGGSKWPTSDRLLGAGI
jgi:anti-sigma-K factor RskA